MFAEIKTDIPALDIVHDNRHQLDGTALSRESLAFLIEIPEENIGGFLYTWVNGAGLAGAAVCLFGEGIGDEPIFEHCDGIAVPADMDFYDWRVNGLSLQIKEALKVLHAQYKSDKLTIDYNFEAVQPAYSYGSHKNGCPQWMATNRFEQQGKLQGTLTFAGRTIEFNGLAQRDHSWGTREWGVNQHWKWLHAQAEGMGVHFWQLYALGETHICGYVFKDGQMAQVADVKTDFTYNEKNMEPVALKTTVTDDLGRSTDIDAEVYAIYPFHVDPMITLFEAPLKLSIDGNAGGGWLESQWPNDLIKYMTEKNA